MMAASRHIEGLKILDPEIHPVDTCFVKVVVTVHGGRLRSSDLGEELEGIELLLPA